MCRHWRKGRFVLAASVFLVAGIIALTFIPAVVWLILLGLLSGIILCCFFKA
jgi:hypothetical protein